MPTVEYEGFKVTCKDAKEVADVIRRVRAQEARISKRSVPGPPAMQSVLAAMFTTTLTTRWTRNSFWEFIENLGDLQKRILALLVEKKRVRDEELRKALKLDSNQQLAGVLSGISKQAGAQNVPARAVYTIENESTSGEITKTYVVSADFLRIALEMNWENE
jgi:hypothetical protein